MNWQGHFFDSLDSTQDYLKAHWSTLPHGTYVVSRQQTRGKGRENRTWESTPGGLYFSVLLKPETLLPLLPWKTWLTTLEALESFSTHPLQLKAPNDILYQGQKLSGILIDGALQGNQVQYYIVGVGINLKQSEFSENVSACRLHDLSSQAISEDTLLNHWLETFTHNLDMPDALWRQQLLRTFGDRQVQIHYTDPHFIYLKEYWHDNAPRISQHFCSPII